MAENDESDYDGEGYEESTAIVSLSELRALGRQIRDRHLLVRTRGAALGRVTRLGTDPIRVGRGQDCELWLGDDGVSRRHALIVAEGGAYWVQDLESANGTFVQGQRVDRLALRDGDVVQFGPVATFRYTITDENQELLLRHLHDASVTDALTGAHNREHFDAQLGSELSYARRHKTNVSVVLMDVDHFKNVNDTYGHQAGDAVLIALARTMQKMVRNEDVFARYGGEEFALVLRGIDLPSAAIAAERLRVAVENMRVPSDAGELRVTVSIGCATAQETQEKTSELLVAAADRRLYAAKHAGRNRVVSSG